MKYLTFRSRFLTAAALGAAVFLAGCAGCGDDADPDPDPVADPAVGAWRGDFGLPGASGFGARVERVVRGPDGRLYAAGIFTHVAGTAAANVAVWDGDGWAPLGAGLDGWVRALAFDGTGTLWAAVTTDEQTGLVRRWDGAAWTTAGTFDAALRDLAVIDGGVVVVGYFGEVDGVTAGGVAVHDGTGWAAVGDGPVIGEATAVARTDTGFCVAGAFEGIGGVTADSAACWGGDQWSPLGARLPGGVSILTRAPDGTWFAGGTLTFLIDPQTGAYQAGVAVLRDDTWEPFEGGIDNGFINEVRAIAFAGDDVLVGGHFESAGRAEVPARHLARWSPAGGWSEVAGGVRNDVGVFLPYYAGPNDILVEEDGALVVGGLFTRIGEVPAVGVARISAAGAPAALVGDETLLGLGGFVDALAVQDGAVIAGGAFGFAGQTSLRNLGALDGTSWRAVGGGIEGIVRDLLVRRDGSLAVAGELWVDGAPAAFAVWREGAWSLPGGRVDGAGFALLEDADGTLWLGGDLFAADTTSLGNLARLEGATWSADGWFDGRVGALARWGDALVAAGSFTTVDEVAAAAVAIREDGAWAALGGGLDGDFAYANTLAASEALGLVVGGAFESAGGVAARGLARWDGTAWDDLGGGLDGLGGYAFASALLPHRDGLFVAGGFEAAGDVAAQNLAWFDGAAWHPLGAGLADLAEAMVVLDDVLYVGGPFTAAGGLPASGLAAWDFALP
jgi:trimeric autotransporter adhesin